MKNFTLLIIDGIIVNYLQMNEKLNLKKQVLHYQKEVLLKLL